MVKLKRQVMKCGYADFTNVMLRDQFVLEVFNDTIGKWLLSVHQLTFVRAVKLAKVIEQVSADVDEMKNSSRQMNYLSSGNSRKRECNYKQLK